MFRRITTGAVAALAAVGFAAPGAAAGSTAYDFYQTASLCSSTGGSGTLSNYDIASGSDQRYHHGARNNYGWTLVNVYYDGSGFPAIQGDKAVSGTKYDGYVDYDNRTTDHRVTWIWRNNTTGATVSCTRTL